MMTTILGQTPHQYPDTTIYTRSEKITSDRNSQDSAKTWILAIAFGVMIAFFLLLFCILEIKKRLEQKKDHYTQRPLSRTSTTMSRKSRNDTRGLYPVYSHRPKPTGEMGAARAALGATISPTPINRSSEEEYTTSIPRNQGYYRPTGEIGAARAALGARVEPEAEQARTNNNRPLRFQQSYIPTDIGSRVVSRPIEQHDSIYTLRPGESVADMMQRVDSEVQRAVSRFLIFANNLPSPPPPAHPRRPSRSRGPMTVDEEVSLQVAAFPIFQQNSRTQHAVATGINEEQYRESTTITAASANTGNDEGELRREVATLPVFQNTASYRPMPTRRPDPVTPGSMTPPPAYSHAPSYRGYDSDEEAPENEAGDAVDDENHGTVLSSLPPAYFSGDYRH
ncbi:hypothetical protein BOTCAL_0218g00050 [Botryotinia calthae]|uniref:Uncharacterized protein n=1 Tax=Botryotinia calthae TaxID=38488 RepID=A0A4Y8CY92_9HELO|nr:hypothetical protein BOTCAL_0218g00050 [Botryotinia calthae]